MGNGYGANYADTVEELFVEEVCPDELRLFKKSLEEAELGDGNIVELFDQGTYESIAADENADVALRKVCLAYSDLISKFEKITGLSLT